MTKKEEGRRKKEEKFWFCIFFPRPSSLVPLLSFVPCLLFSVLCPATAHAAAVYLKNGTVMTGRIVEKNEAFIVLKSGAGPDAVRTTVFLDDILRIESEEDYSQKVSQIPFALFERQPEKIVLKEPFYLKTRASSSTAENIRHLIDENALSKSASGERRLMWTSGEDAQAPEQAGAGGVPAANTEESLRRMPGFSEAVLKGVPYIEISDLYCRKYPLQEAEIILEIRNRSDLVIHAAFFDFEINGVRLPPTARVKIEDIRPREERAVNIASVYQTYKKYMAGRSEGQELPRATKFKIISVDFDEVLFEKVISVFE